MPSPNSHAHATNLRLLALMRSQFPGLEIYREQTIPRRILRAAKYRTRQHATAVPPGESQLVSRPDPAPTRLLPEVTRSCRFEQPQSLPCDAPRPFHPAKATPSSRPLRLRPRSWLRESLHPSCRRFYVPDPSHPLGECWPGKAQCLSSANCVIDRTLLSSHQSAAMRPPRKPQ